MLKRAFLGMALVCLSQTALAVTSVCSGDSSSPSGLTTLRHEATWSLYDNWFYNLHAEVSSNVKGPVSPARVDAYEMNAGGQQSHFLENPVAGDYTLRGQVRVGHPVEWGFDGYHVVECQPWSGRLEGLQEQEEPDGLDSNMDENTVSNHLPLWAGPVDVDTYIKQVCEIGERKEYCEELLAMNDSERKALEDRLGVSKHPTRLVTGFVAAMDEKEIIIRSTAGHYTRLTLAPGVSLTRHKDALLSEVRQEDFVHIQRTIHRQSHPRVLVLRGDVRDSPLYRAIDKQDSAAELPADAIVTIVTSAKISEIELIVSYARVVARQLDSGELEVQRIEILR